MRDALARIVRSDVLDTELACVLGKPFDDIADCGIRDCGDPRLAIEARQIMVRHCECQVWFADLAAFCA